jgi:hypothetical protein
MLPLIDSCSFVRRRETPSNFIWKCPISQGTFLLNRQKRLPESIKVMTCKSFAKLSRGITASFEKNFWKRRRH